MPQRIDSGLILPYVEFVRGRTPDVAPTGRARLYYDKANQILKLSIAGGAYSSLYSQPLANAGLQAPKIVAYQQAVARADFTDGGAAVGTLDLTTSIPAGAIFLRSQVTALTGFTGDTSATLKVGDGTTADRYSTGTPSIFTTAAQGIDIGAPSGTAWHTTAKTPKLTVTSAASFAAVVAGALTVTLYWFQAS